MKQAPRSKDDHIVNYKLMIHAYLFIGIMETFFAHVMFFVYMQYYEGFYPSDLILCFNNWTDGYKGRTQDQLDNAVANAQSVYFVTLVFMQLFGNSLATRTNKLSFFEVLPWKKDSKNLWIFVAQITSLCCMFFVLALPACQSVFKTRLPRVEFYFIGLGFAAIIFTMDELRKLLVRRKVAPFKKLAWWKTYLNKWLK